MAFKNQLRGENVREYRQQSPDSGRGNAFNKKGSRMKIITKNFEKVNRYTYSTISTCRKRGGSDG